LPFVIFVFFAGHSDPRVAKFRVFLAHYTSHLDYLPSVFGLLYVFIVCSRGAERLSP
jgi:hypothetical protein